MDPEVVLFFNHIFGNVFWGLLLLIGIALLVFPLIGKVNARTKKICRIAGVSSIALFVIVCVLCAVTYIVFSVGYAEDEFDSQNDVSAVIVEPYTIRFTNNGEDNATITNRYKIEYLIKNNSWYNVDTDPSDVLEASYESFELAPGESIDLTFDISCYGELKPHHYRYAIEETYSYYYFVEFDITEDGEFIWPE